jgi:TorA maturation chaperone TorD
LAETPSTSGRIAEEDTLRAGVYVLLGWLLRSTPTSEDLQRIAALEGDDSDIGCSISALAKIARAASSDSVREEFHNLFIGLGSGELIPYGSYYMTGFLNEKPLAKLRIDMGRLGIDRAEGVSEPEDHIAALCEMMAGLITGAFGAPADLADQQAFFDAHLAPWAEQFFSDLEAAASAVLYMPVGTIGKLFMRIEVQAFEMAA